MNKTKVLVTGGAGFIGKKLSNFLLDKNNDVLVVDDLSSGNLNSLNRGVRFEKINILDNEKLETKFQKFQPDYVFHLAALNARSANADKDLPNVNIAGTLNVLECSARYKIKKFIYSSSAAVYGDTRKLPTPENVELKPLNLYGVSKAASEVLVNSVLEGPGVPYSILRFSNVYGPGLKFDNEGGVISIFCNNIKNRQKIVVFGDGRQTRDFVYVDDVINALFRSMLYGKSFVANVSSNKETGINDLVDLIKSVTEQDIKPEHKPVLAKEIKRSVLDNSKIKRLLDWRPSICLRTGVALTYNSSYEAF